MIAILITLLGLVVFEIISSIDNAVVNADVLATMKSRKAKRFFITWGMLFAIFVVRGLLPLVIVYVASPGIGIMGALNAVWESTPSVTSAIETATPIILMAGGIFLVLLWAHWLFLEDKKFGLPHERYIQAYGAVWFYSLASLLLLAIIYEIKDSFLPEPMILTLAAAIGFVVFFITQGFKDNAEGIEERLIESGEKSAMSDWAKVFFLEVLDIAFSIDGVVGAFAFTSIIPIILVGNAIGAIVVRQLTIMNIDRIRSYSYLKNGAMYSIGILGFLMLMEAFGVKIDSWVSPVVTIGVIGYFFWRSIAENKANSNTFAGTV